jgi:hypothetical protein
VDVAVALDAGDDFTRAGAREVTFCEAIILLRAIAARYRALSRLWTYSDQHLRTRQDGTRHPRVHRLRDHVPDVQLYVDLRRTTTSSRRPHRTPASGCG